MYVSEEEYLALDSDKFGLTPTGLKHFETLVGLKRQGVSKGDRVKYLKGLQYKAIRTQDQLALQQRQQLITPTEVREKQHFEMPIDQALHERARRLETLQPIDDTKLDARRPSLFDNLPPLTGKNPTVKVPKAKKHRTLLELPHQPSKGVPASKMFDDYDKLMAEHEPKLPSPAHGLPPLPPQRIAKMKGPRGPPPFLPPGFKRPVRSSDKDLRDSTADLKEFIRKEAEEEKRQLKEYGTDKIRHGDDEEEEEAAAYEPGVNLDEFEDDGFMAHDSSEIEYTPLSEDEWEYRSNKKSNKRTSRSSEEEEADPVEISGSDSDDVIVFENVSDADDNVDEEDTEDDYVSPEAKLHMLLHKADERHELDDYEAEKQVDDAIYAGTMNLREESEVRRKFRLKDSFIDTSMFNMLMAILDGILHEENFDRSSISYKDALTAATILIVKERPWRQGMITVNAVYLWLKTKERLINELKESRPEEIQLQSWLKILAEHPTLDDRPKLVTSEGITEKCFRTGVDCHTGVSLVDVHSHKVITTLWYDCTNEEVSFWVSTLTRFFFLPMCLLEWCGRKRSKFGMIISHEQRSYVLKFTEDITEIFVDFLIDEGACLSNKGNLPKP